LLLPLLVSVQDHLNLQLDTGIGPPLNTSNYSLYTRINVAIANKIRQGGGNVRALWQ